MRRNLLPLLATFTLARAWPSWDGVARLADGLEGSISGEIKKLAEDAVDKLIDEAIPDSIEISEARTLNQTVDVPVVGKVGLELSFDGTRMTRLDSAQTVFGNFTQTAVNVTISFPNAVLISNVSGQICDPAASGLLAYVGLSSCRNKTDSISMPLPVTLVTAVHYKLRKIFGIPVGLDGAPCLGPVLNATLGKTNVTGFGVLDKYVTDLVNDAIAVQHLFVTPLDDAVNDELRRFQPKCNLTAPSMHAARAPNLL